MDIGDDAGRSIRVVWLVGLGVLVLVTGLMAWDHLWGNQPGQTDAFPVDLGTFLVAMLISLVCAGVVFPVLIPRARQDASTAPRRALWLSGSAVPLVLVAGWLGFPLILAGGGIALGLVTPRTPARSRPAVVAIILGLLVLAFGILATAFPGAESD